MFFLFCFYKKKTDQIIKKIYRIESARVRGSNKDCIKY